MGCLESIFLGEQFVLVNLFSGYQELVEGLPWVPWVEQCPSAVQNMQEEQKCSEYLFANDNLVEGSQDLELTNSFLERQSLGSIWNQENM